jgi:hypothetical protein
MDVDYESNATNSMPDAIMADFLRLRLSQQNGLNSFM